MTEEESLEVTKIYNISGLLRDGYTLVKNRHFRATHHNALNALFHRSKSPVSLRTIPWRMQKGLKKNADQIEYQYLQSMIVFTLKKRRKP